MKCIRRCISIFLLMLAFGCSRRADIDISPDGESSVSRGASTHSQPEQADESSVDTREGATTTPSDQLPHVDGASPTAPNEPSEAEFVSFALDGRFVIDGPKGATLLDGPPWDLEKGESFEFRIFQQSKDDPWFERRKKEFQADERFIKTVDEGDDYYVYLHKGYQGPEYVFVVAKTAGYWSYELSNSSVGVDVRSEEQLRLHLESARSLREIPEKSD